MWVPCVSLTGQMTLFWIILFINKNNLENDLKCLKTLEIHRKLTVAQIKKTLYMKIDQKNTTNTNTLSMTPPHPSNMPNIEPSPFGPSVR